MAWKRVNPWMQFAGIYDYVAYLQHDWDQHSSGRRSQAWSVTSMNSVGGTYWGGNSTGGTYSGAWRSRAQAGAGKAGAGQGVRKNEEVGSVAAGKTGGKSEGGMGGGGARRKGKLQEVTQRKASAES